jgi:cytochrome c-type biogenesis protein CcmH
MRWLVAVALVFVGASALAVETYEGFDDPVLDARYRDLIHSLRCMQCQNESLAESQVDLAADLRRQVREKMADGWSDAEIKDYLIARYGDFISYKPPFKPSTWLLWTAPGLLLLGGGVVFARILSVRMRQPLDEDVS